MSSNNSQTLVQLNRELPFVKAVFDVIEGRSDLDTVVRILKSEEQAYGVFIHADEFHALWGLSLVPKQEPLNASEILITYSQTFKVNDDIFLNSCMVLF